MAAAHGAQASRVVDGLLYGSRYVPTTNGGTAPARTPASGIGRHSVWQGPRQIKTGAPVLRRNQT
jgi:hypothetical protein